jgi:hypothetical protein
MFYWGAVGACSLVVGSIGVLLLFWGGMVGCNRQHRGTRTTLQVDSELTEHPTVDIFYRHTTISFLRSSILCRFFPLPNQPGRHSASLSYHGFTLPALRCFATRDCARFTTDFTHQVLLHSQPTTCNILWATPPSSLHLCH